MSDQLDTVLQKLSELNDTIRSHADDKATMDKDSIKAELESVIEAQVQMKVAEAEAKRPVRKGELIGPDGFKAPGLGYIESGKFSGQRTSDVLFAHQFLTRAARLGGGAKVAPPSKELEDIATKALTSTGVGTGDELVPTGMAAELWQDFFLQARIVPTIGVVPMPTDPFDWPLGWGAVTWRKGTQNTSVTATDPATAKSTLTSTEQVLEIDWSYDLDEDAIVAVMPSLREMLAREGGEQMDRFVLNADATNAGTGNINLDDADPPDDSYYLSSGQDGIRHLYLVDNSTQSVDVNSTLDDAEMRAGISRLGKYGANYAQCAAVTDVETYMNGILALTNVTTWDKFGPNATVLTGQLAAYQGIPLIVSGAMLEAEDDGKISTTPANNDEGQIAFFHRDMWKVGFRRELLIEVDRDIQKRQFIMVVSFRIAVAARGTRASAVHTSGIHGIVRA